jgi:purine-binding chemotaxis protein CheW
MSELNVETSRYIDKPADYVTFTIGNQLFGIAVKDVLDVFIPQAITRVPLAPPEVGGVLNLRGRIVTMIDVRERLGLPPRKANSASMAVGIERSGESYGLIIDQIGEVVTLDLADLQRTPENLDLKWRRVSRGIYRIEGTLLIVLDVNLLVSFDRRLERSGLENSRSGSAG